MAGTSEISGDRKVYPILWPGHSVIGSRGCPRRLWKRTQLTQKSTLSCPPDLRKTPSSPRRHKSGSLCGPNLCLPQRLTASAAPSCMEAATSCPKNFGGKAATFLLDTGCITNLLSRRLFDTLGARERASLVPYKGAHGTLANGSCIPFYGLISLPGRVRDQAIYETFIVSQLKEDAIRGMSFLEKPQCRMDFQKSVVVMAGKELVCIDKFGRPLVGGDQVVWNCTVPGRSQATFRCRVNYMSIATLEVVEGTHGAIRLANSLNRLDCWQELLVQCINPSRNLSDYWLERWWGSTTPSRRRMWVRHWKQWAIPRKTPLKPAEEQSQSIWRTCTMGRVGTVQVVPNAKYWLNYSQSTVMSSVVAMETWG